MTVSLFIIVAIVYRFITDFEWNSREQLKTNLQFSSIEKLVDWSRRVEISTRVEISIRVLTSRDHFC